MRANLMEEPRMSTADEAIGIQAIEEGRFTREVWKLAGIKDAVDIGFAIAGMGTDIQAAPIGLFGCWTVINIGCERGAGRESQKGDSR